MAPAQLSRLRPQITALASQFEDVDTFLLSLTALLKEYSSDIDNAASGITPYSLMPKLNIPAVVINQMEISFNHLGKAHPNQAINIAERLWKRDQFEYKKIALLLLISLPLESLNKYFNNLGIWIDKDTEKLIIDVILEAAKKNSTIGSQVQWKELVFRWIGASDTRLKKFGLEAIANFIQSNPDYPLPEIFKRIEPVFSQPHITINADLIYLIEVLASNSVNETAAFLILLSIHNPNSDTCSFIRKCLPVFPDFLAEKIKETLPE